MFVSYFHWMLSRGRACPAVLRVDCLAANRKLTERGKQFLISSFIPFLITIVHTNCNSSKLKLRILVQSVSKFADESNTDAVKELVTKGEVSFSEFATAFRKFSEVCHAPKQCDVVAGSSYSKLPPANMAERSCRMPRGTGMPSA